MSHGPFHFLEWVAGITAGVTVLIGGWWTKMTHGRISKKVEIRTFESFVDENSRAHEGMSDNLETVRKEVRDDIKELRNLVMSLFRQNSCKPEHRE